MKNEERYQEEIFKLLNDNSIRDTDEPYIKELFKELLLTPNKEVDKEELIKKILRDE